MTKEQPSDNPFQSLDKSQYRDARQERRPLGDVCRRQRLHVRVLLPELVYMTIVTVPLYRVLFGINEWLELKEKYKYRLF